MTCKKYPLHTIYIHFSSKGALSMNCTAPFEGVDFSFEFVQRLAWNFVCFVDMKVDMPEEVVAALLIMTEGNT